MPLDVEQADERTQLLLHTANDRRLSQLQHDEEARSIVDSAVSKEEAALWASTVGERLPYNDYTTIDWLHDLARLPTLNSNFILTFPRSKIPTAIDPYTAQRAFEMLLLQPSTPVRDG